MITASRDSCHAASEPRDIYGSGTVIGRAIAELTILVYAPALHAATRGQRTGVITSKSYLADTSEWDVGGEGRKRADER